MDRIAAAFDIVKRKDFLPDDLGDAAEFDIPIPIGYGQTNSQPSTVRHMLEWLSPQAGDKVLDVGFGSGWTTALLSYIVGDKGHIYATELIPELVEFGKANCVRSGVRNASYSHAHSVPGWPSHAPYDCILVSAAAEVIPTSLLDQLKVGGRMVIPVGESIFVVNQVKLEEFETTEHTGYVFVPLESPR